MNRKIIAVLAATLLALIAATVWVPCREHVAPLPFSALAALPRLDLDSTSWRTVDRAMPPGIASTIPPDNWFPIEPPWPPRWRSIGSIRLAPQRASIAHALVDRVSWGLLLAIHALILLLGGGLLTVVVRRERRRKAAP